MIKTRTMSNIDALKLCCTEHGKLFNDLLNVDRVEFNDFIIKVEGRVMEEEQIIDIMCLIYAKTYDFPFAKLKLPKNNPYSSLEINNQALYQVVRMSGSEKVNMISLLPSFWQETGLKFHNITRLEVCLDMNVSAITRIRYALRDVDGLDLYINGKRIAPNAVIPRHKVCYQETRLRLCNKPTLYFDNYNKSLQMDCYDKNREIMDASNYKEYIREWDEIFGQKLQRIELRVTKDEIRDYCSEHLKKEEELLNGLIYEDVRRGLLEWGINRLIYFNPMEYSRKKKLKKVTIFDVVGV